MDPQQIAEEIRTLKARNHRVESEKAWETSCFRAASITLLTYAVAGLVLLSIGNPNPWRNALIPAVGFFLSTLSLPVLKRRWIEKHLQKHG
jgi:hypothetical protein